MDFYRTQGHVKPRTLNTGYSKKADNVNVYWGNTLHSLKK